MPCYEYETILNGALSVFVLTAHDCKVAYLLLGGLLDAFLQRFLVHGSADARHSPGFAVLDTEPQVLELGDVVLAQSLILLTWEASHAPALHIRIQKATHTSNANERDTVLMLQKH